MRPVGILVFTLLLALSLNTLLASSTTNLVASITVPCPFALTFNTLPTYTLFPGNILMNFTIFSQGGCTIPPPSGNLIIMRKDNNDIVLNQQLTTNTVTSTPKFYDVTFNNSVLTNTTYTATVKFSEFTATNSVSNDFTAINPQKLVISSITAPSSLTPGEVLNLEIVTKNTGQLASGASTLYVNISGPQPFSASFPETSLSPGQNSSYLISVSNASSEAGTYTATAHQAYLLNGANAISNTASTTYLVKSNAPSGPGSAQGGGAVSKSTTPITPLPALSLTSVPLYTSISSGTPSLALIGVENTGTAPESITFSIPKEYSGFLSLSSTSLNLDPKQSVSMQMFVNPNTTIPTGTYIVPVTIKLDSAGTTANQTEYFTFNLYAPQNRSVVVVNQLSLLNYTQMARGVIQISNPTKNTAHNLTLQTLIPLALAKNISDIQTSGFPTTITDPPGFYTINWKIGELGAGAVTFAYYTISNPQSQGLLQRIQNVLASPSQPSPSSILKVVNIAFPTFYTNSSNNIQVYSLFTGTQEQQVHYTMTSPSAIQIRNATQAINASPNQLLGPSFQIQTSAQPGTYLLSLYISTQGFNATYSLPLIVLANPSESTTSSRQFPINLRLSNAGIGAIAAVVAIIAIAIAAFLLNSYMQKPRYRRETSEQLVRLREQIKRSENE
ncbi:MAG: hypothetical protein KGH61_03425 [Candidatus Micrarchaeota archaeon]|nr:hypothetical protein [Candidatus Micrarchaeota archaeon]MDE1847973.1 hypothetical protein [Candidatus Micrarchaeota archaeon]MDE1864684.1 hypothetical protein [Candidatus Micrarchaeota archaeon]